MSGQRRCVRPALETLELDRVRYNGSRWVQRTASEATALDAGEGVSQTGGIPAIFPGYGLLYSDFPESRWNEMTAAAVRDVQYADRVAYDQVYALFPDGRLWAASPALDNWTLVARQVRFYAAT